MNEYELICILPPAVEEESTNAATETITAFLQSLNGEIVEVKPWGRRRLAFPIGGHREGNYVEYQLKLDPALTQQLERGMKLNEDVIRYLLINKAHL